MAHVVAWAIVTGEWSAYEIDHRDRDQGNNIWTNLREATHLQNASNLGVSKANRTGVRGVSRYGKRFRACITTKGQRLSLGLFDTVADAAAARHNAEERYFGKFR